jgi:hypothetical protein
MVEIEQTKPEILHTTPFPPGGMGSEISIRDLGVERPTEPADLRGLPSLVVPKPTGGTCPRRYPS